MPRNRRLLSLAIRALLSAGLTASPCLAQEHTEPDPIGEPEQPEAEEPQPIPGLEESDFRIRPAGITPEGTFLSRRAGRVVRLPGGERAFVFHPDPQGLALRPMILMPSLTLQRMEQSMEDRDPRFLITGEVFVYQGVNYLLPTWFGIARGEVETGLPPASPAPGTAPPTDPEVEDLIKRLEEQRQRPRVADPGARPSQADQQPTPIAPQGAEAARDALADPLGGLSGIVPEGRVLSRRRARLIRLAAGEWAVTFDNGPRQDPSLDRPMVLLPSLNLQRLQNWAGTYGDTMPLEISGRITQYRGRNYLIPTLYRIAPVLTPLEPIQ